MWLNSCKTSFDVIVMTRRGWIIVSTDGYDVFCNSASRNQNDGVVVYVRNYFTA